MLLFLLGFHLLKCLTVNIFKLHAPTPLFFFPPDTVLLCSFVYSTVTFRSTHIMWQQNWLCNIPVITSPSPSILPAKPSLPKCFITTKYNFVLTSRTTYMIYFLHLLTYPNSDTVKFPSDQYCPSDLSYGGDHKQTQLPAERAEFTPEWSNSQAQRMWQWDRGVEGWKDGAPGSPKHWLHFSSFSTASPLAYSHIRDSPPKTWRQKRKQMHSN